MLAFKLQLLVVPAKYLILEDESNPLSEILSHLTELANSWLIVWLHLFYLFSCFSGFFFVCFLHQQTPLHIAARKGYVKTVECLVDLGADISIKDSKEVSMCDHTTKDRVVLLI